MENQKELNCVNCLHKNVCKNTVMNKQAWEKLMVSQEYQHLVKYGMDFIVSCRDFIKREGKIIKGE